MIHGLSNSVLRSISRQLVIILLMVEQSNMNQMLTPISDLGNYSAESSNNNFSLYWLLKTGVNIYCSLIACKMKR